MAYHTGGFKQSQPEMSSYDQATAYLLQEATISNQNEDEQD